jgi:hypothetical protein
MDYLLFLVSLQVGGNVSKAQSFIDNPKIGLPLFHITQAIASLNSQNKIELLNDINVVQFLQIHSSPVGWEAMFFEDNNLMETDYLPQACHGMVRTFLEFKKIKPRNKFMRFNTDTSSAPNPFQETIDYLISSEPNETFEQKILKQSDTSYIPFFEQILNKNYKLNRMDLVEDLLLVQGYNFYSCVSFVLNLPDSNKLRKAWFQYWRKRPLFETKFYTFNEIVACMNQVFVLPDSCWAYQYTKNQTDKTQPQNPTENACENCNTLQWNTLATQFRCVAYCTEQKLQCARHNYRVFDTCAFHEKETNRMPYCSFNLNKEIVIKKLNYAKVPYPKDALIFGEFAIAEAMIACDSNTYFHVKRITIVSHRKPNVPQLAIDNKEMTEPKEQPNYDPNTIWKIFTFSCYDPQENTMQVTWIQNRNPNVRIPSFSSLLNLDAEIYLDLEQGLGYMAPSSILHKKTKVKLQSNIRWHVNVTSEAILAALKRAVKWEQNQDIPFYTWSKIDWEMIMNTYFPNDIVLFLNLLLAWNAEVKRFQSESLPLLLLMPPPSKKHIELQDLKLIVKEYDIDLTWKYEVQTMEEYKQEGNNRFVLTFLQGNHSHDIPLFLDNKGNPKYITLDRLLYPSTRFEEKEFDNNVPQSCFSFIEGDIDIHEYVKDNPLPYVFVRKRNNVEWESACITRDEIKRISDQPEGRYYECVRDDTPYALSDRMYIKLLVFADPIFITKENYEFLLQSENIYFIVEEHPFHKLSYSTKATFIHPDARADEGVDVDVGGYVSSDHCQAGTNKDIYMIFPIDLHRLNIQPLKRRVVVHM